MELIKEIEARFKDTPHAKETYTGELLTRAVTELSKSQWIPVSPETMPEPKALVDVWHNGIRFPNCYLAGDNFESRRKYCTDEELDKWAPKYIFRIGTVDYWKALDVPK